MLRKTARHLTLINALVFVFVLIIFSIAVYTSFVKSIDSDKHEHLQKLADAIDASIGDPSYEEPDDRIPDMVHDEDSPGSAKALQETIQWFDAREQLVAEKGLLKITVPLNPSAAFVTQQNPHALLLTRGVERHGEVIGYLRVGTSLAEADLSKQKLLIGLAFGVAISILVSGTAILWLVRQALKPVERSMKQLSDFTTDASHELQSPVAAIRTNGEVALKYSEGMRASDKEKIVSIVNAANQMSSTIDALLTLAEFELPLAEFENLNVRDLWNELSNDLADAITAKSLKLQVEIESPELSFWARKADAKTVLLNVVKNAILYSHEAGFICVRARRMSQMIQLEIKDTGIGISKEDLPRIFDRFWRSDKARSYRSGGNGLGLAITKNIIERYKGSISVASSLGNGTAVTIRFPANRN